MNKQEFPAGKLVINFRPGFYPFVIIKQASNFCWLNIPFFRQKNDGKTIQCSCRMLKICKPEGHIERTIYKIKNYIPPEVEAYYDPGAWYDFDNASVIQTIK
jgi:hypothetical protein